MAILVDYRCLECGGRAEHWMPSPPPADVACIACGGASMRLFAAVGLSGGMGRGPAADAAEGPSDPTSRFGSPSLCAQYPQIPGLCHMSESAGRMWVAKYTGNSRAVDREQERQEKAAALRNPTLSDAISHHHA